MKEIITNVAILHTPSIPAQVNPDLSLHIETENIIKELYDTLPENDLGLAASQIGILQRIFIARLSSGVYAFVNPSLQKSDATFVSNEGCLSIPKTTREIERATKVKIEADIYKVSRASDNQIEINPFSIKVPDQNNKNGDTYIDEPIKSLELFFLESSIVQHEYDHLEGVLLIDYPSVPTAKIKQFEDNKKRQKKLVDRREKKKNQTQHQELKRLAKVNPQKSKKHKQFHKSYEKRLKQIIEAQEYRNAIQSGAINPNTQ